MDFYPIASLAPITSKEFTKEYPTNLFLRITDSGLDLDSTVLMNQIKTIDKMRITKVVGKLDSELMRKIDLALKVSLGLDSANFISDTYLPEKIKKKGLLG